MATVFPEMSTLELKRIAAEIVMIAKMGTAKGGLRGIDTNPAAMAAAVVVFTLK